MENTNPVLPNLNTNHLKLSDRITFTKAAVGHITQQIKKRGTGVGIKFGVKKVGCSGLMYVVDFIDKFNKDDYAFEINDRLCAYVDHTSFPYVKGTCVDYQKKGLSEEFIFHNPNIKDTCGCGESFNI